MKKIIKGLINGTIGVDLVKLFDKNGDGSVSWKEIKNASADQWIRFAVSTGTSIISILFFL
jgi:hypothetical protein